MLVAKILKTILDAVAENEEGSKSIELKVTQNILEWSLAEKK